MRFSSEVYDTEIKREFGRFFKWTGNKRGPARLLSLRNLPNFPTQMHIANTFGTEILCWYVSKSTSIWIDKVKPHPNISRMSPNSLRLHKAFKPNRSQSRRKRIEETEGHVL